MNALFDAERVHHVPSEGLALAREAEQVVGETPVVVLALSRARGTLLFRDGLRHLYAALQRCPALPRLPIVAPELAAEAIVDLLAEGAEAPGLVLVIDGVVGEWTAFVDRLVAAAGPGIRLRIGLPRPAPEDHLLAGAWAPLTTEELAAALDRSVGEVPAAVAHPSVSQLPDGRWVSAAACPPTEGGWLEAWLRRVVRDVDPPPYARTAAHRHLTELSDLAPLVGRGFQRPVLHETAFARAWDAAVVRRAACAAAAAPDARTAALALAVRATVVELTAMEPLRDADVDLAGRPYADAPLGPIAPVPDDDLETLLAAAPDVLDTSGPVADRVRRLLGGASTPKGFSRLVERAARGEASEAVLRDAGGVRGAALAALVAAAEPEHRAAFARAAWPRVLDSLAHARSREAVFDLSPFAEWLGPDEALVFVPKALAALALGPSRPDALVAADHHDLRRAIALCGCAATGSVEAIRAELHDLLEAPTP